MPVKRRRTGKGAGLYQRRRKKYRYKRKTRRTRRTSTFKKKFRRELGKLTEQRGYAYWVKTKGGTAAGPIVMEPWRPRDEYAMIGDDLGDLPVFTGFSPFHPYPTAEDRFGTEHGGGNTIFPFNLAFKQQGWFGHVQPGGADPTDTEIMRPRFNGNSFQPTYLKVDYGYLQGSTFDSHLTPYLDQEVVFGIITNPKDVQDYMETSSSTLTHCINLVLGNKCNRNWAVNTGSVGKKMQPMWRGSAAHSDDQYHWLQEHFITGRRRMKRDIKILKRDMYRHRALVKKAADGGDGVADVSAKEAGRLWGQGSFKFPARFLTELTMDEKHSGDTWNQEFDDAHIEADGTSNPHNTFRYTKNIPFIHFRGSCVYADAAASHLPYSLAEANKHLHTFCRFKIKLLDL